MSRFIKHSTYNSLGLFVLIVLHTVGLIQVILMENFELMESSKWIILLSFIICILPLMLEYKVLWLPFIAVYIIGVSTEAIGVNTALLFGNYSYGSALGLKLFGTPLIIGVLWLSLSIGIQSFLKRKMKSKYVIAIFGSLLMVGLDILIEPVAVHFDFWTWAGNEIPLYNYVSWFLIAFIIQLILANYSIKKNLFEELFLINCIFFACLHTII